MRSREAETFLRRFEDKAVFVDNVLHLSRELQNHPDLPTLLYLLHDEKNMPEWHDPEDFIRRFQGEAFEARVGDNEMQRYVIRLLQTAYEKKASDIHIVNTGQYTSIKLRVLGRIEDHDQQSSVFGDHLTAMLYNYFAQQTGTAVFNRLQRLDGRIISREVLPRGVPSVRLHAEPIQSEARDAGTFMALRLLYDSTDCEGSLSERLHQLGFLEKQRKDIEAMAAGKGLSIVSGATGHGKSTVLKHIFEAMVQKQPNRSYLSVEDPPEYRIAGVNQIQVRTQQEENIHGRAIQYRDAIAGAMRSDPDVLMIGEIRYAEAAEAAVSAALTGHSVWATLHAADAFACIVRMENLLRQMNLANASDLLCDAAVLRGLTYQRLLPVLCPSCKKRLCDLGKKERVRILGEDLEQRIAALSRRRESGICLRGEGCEKCGGNGNIAMTVAAETVLLDEDLLFLLRQNKAEAARKLWKKRGGMTCLEVAVQKLRQGDIDPRDCELRLGRQLILEKGR